MSFTFTKIKDQQGLTLMELVVALSLTGLLLIVLIGANVFVHKVLTNWSKENSLVEERVIILEELAGSIALCDYLVFDTTSCKLLCFMQKDTIEYYLSDGDILINGKLLNRSGFNVDFYKVSQDAFAISNSAVILESEELKKPIASLYTIDLSVSYKGKTDVSVKKIRNNLAFSRQ